MNRDRLVIGNDSFDWQGLMGGRVCIANSLPCDELSVDTLTAAADCSSLIPTIFRPADADGILTSEQELFGVRPILRVLVHDLSLYGYGEPVYHYRGENLLGKFFMTSTVRKGRYLHEIVCTSAIGLLENSTHYGGLYTGQPMEDVLGDIIGGVIEYSLDIAFVGMAVYGWLPIATRRGNLQQLLFSVGGSVRKDAAGNPVFAPLSSGNPAALENSRVFVGGNVDYRTPVNEVNVSEHAYMAYPTDKEATLYEGEAPAEPLVSPKGLDMVGVLVRFDGPMHSLAVDAGQILESGVNYAVLGAASSCKLVGREYTHTTRVITAAKAAARGLVSQKDNVVTVTDATLVSMANSENVAARVLAYYGQAATVRTDFVVQGERAGDPVSLTDPFGEPVDGFIQSMDFAMGGLLRASARIVKGYVPTGIGNYYQHFMVVSASGPVTIPPECKGKVRAVLIGGGPGGCSGCKGEDGKAASGSSYGASGAGGLAGKGGDGGKVLIATIQATPGQVLQATIGVGGKGGIMQTDGTSGAGTDGTPTTLGDLTSANGTPSDSGYVNIMDGTVYGVPGLSGIDGGKGQQSDSTRPTVDYKGTTYRAGDKGAYASMHGQSGAGGLGGGAAAGANGTQGGNASAEDNNGNGFANGGQGGAGATGAKGDKATIPGGGGHGGHGGGGGGGGGGVSGSYNYTWPGPGGTGGDAGPGGDGEAGILIIYY